MTDSVKKRIQKERNKAPVYKTKVYLGGQYERWMLKKEELGETHAGLAKILFDRYTSLYYLQWCIFSLYFIEFNALHAIRIMCFVKKDILMWNLLRETSLRCHCVFISKGGWYLGPPKVALSIITFRELFPS